MGLAVEVPPDNGIEVWPDNWETVVLFNALATQWVIGVTGRVCGLRYESLPIVAEMVGIERARLRDVFAGVQLMESTALSEFNKK